MSQLRDWWASLNHGGLLISPGKISECFPAELPALPGWQAERMRRALTAFDGSAESLGTLLDFVLEDLSGLPEGEWQKAQFVDSRWAIQSFTGTQVKPRRIWLGPQGEALPLFVPEDGASRQFSGRLGVGRSRQLLSRVVEWLRRQNQPLALVTNGRQWRLVHAGQDYEAWCEWDIDLWFEEGQPGAQVLAWRQLLHREALLAPGAVGKSLLVAAIVDSRKGQSELSAILGERVRKAVEELITASHAAIEQAQQAGNAPDYRDLYLAGTRIVMRCIITLFAEARGLLPVDNPIYQHAYSLEGLRQQLDRRAGGRGNERLTQGRSAWPRLIGLFNLIYQGSAHEALPVPQYSGGLFAPGDAQGSDPIARALALLEGPANAISDRQVLSILRLLTRTRIRLRQGRKSTWVDGPVDFSTLSSEYIGILYEGLLDYELKQAAKDDPVIFLNVGRQPALTLSQLEAMDDKAIKQLFEALKKKEKAGGDDAGDEDEAAEEGADEAAGDEPVDEEVEEVEETTEVVAEETELALSADHLARAQRWLEHAAEIAGLIKKSRGRQAADQAAERERAGRLLRERIVAPGQFYLVRWGGTRKGAGTFYTRPQLAAPTVRRTLQPLVFAPVRTELNPRTGLEDVVEWSPRKPEEILALKVCDPAMGSGSFLAGALRYLTDALVQSLFHHQRIQRRADGAVAKLADGKESRGLEDEKLPLPPEHEGFEDALRAQLKRHIVERCIYGVDLDPLAVELGRMALWVETMDRSLPFGFLDHKLKVGNSLVGAWFDTFRDYPAMAWEREGGDKDYQKDKPDNLINHFYIDAKGKKRGDVFTAAIKARSKSVPEELIAQLSGQLRLDDEIKAADIHGELVAVFEKLHQLPVHDTERRAALYRDQVLNNPRFHALKARMDLWCALWFWPGDSIEAAPLPSGFASPDVQALAIAVEIAARHQFFHWELEFPDVFTPKRAGFDALLGNPPWEIQKPNSKEFFSNHDPLYRAYGKQDALAHQLDYFREDATLEHRWIAYNANLKSLSGWAKYAGHPFGDRVSEDREGRKSHDLNLGGRGGNSFAASAELHRKWKAQRAKRAGYADPAHPFLHQGSADLNTYKMFLELSHALLKPAGRMGMIVPSGIYTDKGTTDLRDLFLSQCDWQWLFGFENREAIFDIHRSFKFCPLVIRKGGETSAIRAAFMHRNVDDWDNADVHVLAYPRARVEEFSPYSKAILEIRSDQDLRVMQKIYSNGVLLGDQSERGWGVKYAREFDMTNDSKLFPPRPKWEEKGYQPDEYGHWLKGPWRAYAGPKDILERKDGLVLSRDGSQAMSVTDIEDVALPLYEGRMIGQFDFSEKGWVSGKGRSAVWREIPFEAKVIEPQYLAGLQGVKESPKSYLRPKIAYMRIGSATNSRTAISTFLDVYPAGDSVFFYRPLESSYLTSMAVSANLDSIAYDYHLRNRVGGLNLSEFIMDETAVIGAATIRKNVPLLSMIQRLVLCAESQAASLAALFAEVPELKAYSRNGSWRHQWAVSTHERCRLRASIDAIYAMAYGLSWDELVYVLKGCDMPKSMLSDAYEAGLVDGKGFWRVDKDLNPELRHTVLTLVAFRDLQEKGFEAFTHQNAGEGWMIPETLRLADYGLGHDARAQEHQPVASRLGPRFHDWQLNEDVERSWQECAAHAALIRRIVPLGDAATTGKSSTPAKASPQDVQGALF